MASIIPPNVFSDQVKRLIAVFVAGSIRPSSESFRAIHRSYQYLRKAIASLIQDKILTYTSDRPRAIRFTQYGLECLNREMPEAYQYYMAESNGNHPGSSKEHKKRMRRQGMIQGCIMAAKVQIGSQRPLLSELWQGFDQKLEFKQAAYFTWKEVMALKNMHAMEKQKEVKKGQEQQSRASGMVFSRCMKAPVYALIDDEYMRICPVVEERMKTSAWSAFGISLHPNEEYIKFSHNIVIYNKEKHVLSRLEAFRVRSGNQTQNQSNSSDKPKKKKRMRRDTKAKEQEKKMSIYREMTDLSKVGKSFHLIPANPDGGDVLYLLLNYSKTEIFEMVANSSAGIQRGIEMKGSSLSVRGQEVFEFLACNISGLEIVRKNHAGNQKNSHSKQIPIVLCWSHQEKFVRRYLKDVTCEIETIPVGRVIWEKEHCTHYTVSELQDALYDNALDIATVHQNEDVEVEGYLYSVDRNGAYFSIDNGQKNAILVDDIRCEITAEKQKEQIIKMRTGDHVLVRGMITSIDEILGYTMIVYSIRALK